MYKKKFTNKSQLICFSTNQSLNYKIVRYGVGLIKAGIICYSGITPGHPGTVSFHFAKQTIGIWKGAGNVVKQVKKKPGVIIIGGVTYVLDQVFGPEIREFAIIAKTQGMEPAIQNFKATWAPLPNVQSEQLLNLSHDHYTIAQTLSKLPFKQRKEIIKNILENRGLDYVTQLREKVGPTLVPKLLNRGGAFSLLGITLNIIVKIFNLTTLVYSFYLFYIFLEGYVIAIHEFDSAYFEYTKKNKPNLLNFVKHYYLEKVWPFPFICFKQNLKNYLCNVNFIADDSMYIPNIDLGFDKFQQN